MILKNTDGNIIKTSTFPRGPVRNLDRGDIVKRMTVSGFVDTYVDHLVLNDEYYDPSFTPSELRTNEDRWKFMVNNKIEFIHQYDVDGKLDCIDIYSGTFDGTVIVQDQDALKSLREAIDYLMDMDETN